MPSSNQDFIAKFNFQKLGRTTKNHTSPVPDTYAHSTRAKLTG